MAVIVMEGKKDLSISTEIVDVSNPSKVYVPLINCGVLCTATAKKGKKVKKGTKIGVRKDLDFPILSPVSGTVLDIKECLYLSGEKVPCVVISNDKLEKTVSKKLVKDITSYSKDEFVELLRKCAVTGMGGSDFPTFIKYKSDLKILIVNAVECEPYLTADTMLARLKSEEILECISAIMKINGIKKCFIAYKGNNSVVRDAFEPYINEYKDILLKPVKNIYPAGWERSVVKSVLSLDYDKYPSEIGVVVNNISTIYAIYKALKYQRNATKRIVTLSGEGFNEPVNILAKYGTELGPIVRKLGKYKVSSRIVAGGPMMGRALMNDNVVVTANLNGLLFLKDLKEEVNNCMGCGRCIKVCPQKLCPVFIMKNINNIDKLKDFHPELCVECGLCSYICPSKLGLRDAVIMAKKKVK